MQLQRQFSGQRITLDTSNVIASGGEGRIYAILQDSSLVAKIYNQPTDEKADKLTVMFSAPPDAPIAAPGHASIAWPIDLLKTVGEREHIVGFLMPRVNKVSPIHVYYTPKTRREQKPLFNYLYLHRTARNLASAVNALHGRGYVIGDVNESNILVTDTALVTLVDTDSFQVRDPYTGYVFRCPVGKAEFTPPELQGQAFRDVDRTPEQDLFGLGVLLFQLLLEGTHPFAGVYQGNGDPPPLATRIRSGHYPYGTQRVPYRPMPAAPALELLHPTLREMFLRCFEGGYADPLARPEAKSWVSALKEAEDALVTCAKNNQHKYGSHLRHCPWCERAKFLKGRDPFPSRQVVRTGQHLQPLKPKRKHQPPPRPATKPQPTRSPSTARIPQKLGQYQPPLITKPMSAPTPALPVMPVSRFQGLLQDSLWGTLWGALCLAALSGVISAIWEGGGAIVGAIFVGTLWGAFFGTFWSLFTVPNHQPARKWGGIFVGAAAGAFLLAAVAGAVYGAINRQASTGEAIVAGAFAGILWGVVWNSFKPPLALPLPGRIWGRKGATLGATWGGFWGTVAGAAIGIGSVIWPELNGKNTAFNELVPLVIGVMILAAGVGAIGGIGSGAILGVCGAAPRLPVSFQPSGSKGALLGGIWGTYLGGLAGTILGGIWSVSFPLFNGGGILDPMTALGTTVAAAGVGAIWGLISGGVWGGLGKW